MIFRVTANVSRAAHRAARFILAGCFILIASGGCMAAAGAGINSQFLDAAARGDATRVGALLSEGADIEARDRSGRTALLLSTHGNHVDVARLLIAAGADVNAKDSISDTPYLYAGAEGRNEILMMTLEAGADLASTNRYGGTALIPAAHHGHPETVKILLGTAININHINRLGWTALIEAVILSDGGPVHTEIVRLLVDAGADVNIADRDGVTPLAHARRRGYARMVAILEKAGAK
ncbi:MAG: ankyrin repeat domain-containing protein [Rhizobiales bacterium]|nr:ankyrin repeat domain-containing protein [Hyphomicrobiales bacterium]